MPVMLFQKNSIYILQANNIDYIHFVCDIPELGDGQKPLIEGQTIQ
jgi:hypothetical protein